MEICAVLDDYVIGQDYAKRVYDTLELGGVARADFILDEAGTPWFLEINTLPGMTATSLSPMAAKEVGISFEELVERGLVGGLLNAGARSQRTPVVDADANEKHGRQRGK